LYYNNTTATDENSDAEEESDCEVENDKDHKQTADINRFLMLLRAEIKSESEH
jgi:hypothetical protein